MTLRHIRLWPSEIRRFSLHPETSDEKDGDRHGNQLGSRHCHPHSPYSENFRQGQEKYSDKPEGSQKRQKCRTLSVRQCGKGSGGENIDAAKEKGKRKDRETFPGDCIDRGAFWGEDAGQKGAKAYRKKKDENRNA